MTLDEARRKFESRFSVYPGNEGLRTWRAPTGEEYTEVVIGRDPMFRTEDGAVSALFAALDAYAADKTGTLFWRSPPEVDKHYYDIRRPKGEDRLWIWKGYARLLISDKPNLSSVAA